MTHNGFPVLNTAGKLVGIIARDFLIVMIRNRAIYNPRNRMSTAINDNPIRLSEEED